MWPISGELIGYHAILSEYRYPDSAAALEECKIVFIPKEDFLITLDQSDGIEQASIKNAEP